MGAWRRESALRVVGSAAPPRPPPDDSPSSPRRRRTIAVAPAASPRRPARRGAAATARRRRLGRESSSRVSDPPPERPRREPRRRRAPTRGEIAARARAGGSLNVPVPPSALAASGASARPHASEAHAACCESFASGPGAPPPTRRAAAGAAARRQQISLMLISMLRGGRARAQARTRAIRAKVMRRVTDAQLRLTSRRSAAASDSHWSCSGENASAAILPAGAAARLGS